MLSLKVMEGAGPGLTCLSRRVEEGIAEQVSLGGDNTWGRREETSQEGFLCQHLREIAAPWVAGVGGSGPALRPPLFTTWIHMDRPHPHAGGQPQGMALLLVLPRPLAMILSGKGELKAAWSAVTWLSFCLVFQESVVVLLLRASLSFLTFRTFQMSPAQIPPETARGCQAQVLLPEESEVGRLEAPPSPLGPWHVVSSPRACKCMAAALLCASRRLPF